MRKSFIYLLLLIFSMACGSPANDAKSASNVAVGGGNTVLANENKPANVEKTPVQAKENKQTDELPKFEKQEDYKKSVRQKLLKAGWSPAQSDEGKQNCSGQQSLCDELPELEAGPSSPLGQAITRWKKGDKILLVSTIDSFLFDGYQYEKPKKATTAQNLDISGTYIYESKHEYGSDKYYWEFTSDNKTLFSGEVEGGDFPNQPGEWVWDDAKQEIIVTMSDEKNGVYVFKQEGKNLKMIKEPKLPQGTVGFVGTVFKRK